MNTGFLGPAVATVLTVYGIETHVVLAGIDHQFAELQQYLPFTVLKPKCTTTLFRHSNVATVLTVYGIET